MLNTAAWADTIQNEYIAIMHKLYGTYRNYLAS